MQDDSRVEWPIRSCKILDEVRTSCCQLIIDGPGGSESGLSASGRAFESECCNNVGSDVGMDGLGNKVSQNGQRCRQSTLPNQRPNRRGRNQECDLPAGNLARIDQ